MGSRTRGTRTACRCPIKALSVQDRGGALSWELLGARSSHFGLALTSTRPRTPRSIARRPSAAARQALPSDAPPGVSLPACGQLASPAAARAQCVWQLCWHQRLKQWDSCPKRHHGPRACHGLWTLGQLGVPRLLGRAGCSVPPSLHPRVLGISSPSQLRVWH